MARLALSKENSHLLLPVGTPSSLLSNENSALKQQTRGGLRRPRTLLLASLCLWSALLASAPRLGLNKTVSFTVYSSLDGAALDDVLLVSSPSCATPSVTAAAVPLTTPSPALAPVENTYGEDLTSTAWSDISEAAMEARVLSAEEDEVMDSEWRLVLPEETLDSMTAQQRESLSALRDFWDAMEVVVGDPFEAEEIREEFEEQLSEQLEQAHDEDREEAATTAATITQEELVQGMEEKMMDARDRITRDEEEEARQGKVFEYVPFWTEAMLFAISFAIGCVLVALAQARAQTLDLLQSASARQKRFGDEDDDEVNESSDDDIDADSDSDSEREDIASLSEKGTYKSLSLSSTKNKNKPTVIPTAVNRLLLLSALASNFWVVHSEYWDLPALIFVGLGSTAVLLAHSWVPRDL
ncbi:hypothetical protein BGW39_006139 [Mortierella sp. 14UC]|nr:hypothetical protein BGW39_006139 [Mortierella sp. 14UC]